MALITLPTTVDRQITDRRQITEVMRQYDLGGFWWTPVEAQSYTDPNTGWPNVKPREGFGNADLISNGPVPFAPDGFRPAQFRDQVEGSPSNTAPYFSMTYVPGSVRTASIVVSTKCFADFTEVFGISVDGGAAAAASMGLRPMHNGNIGVVRATGIVQRSSISVAAGEDHTIFLFVDFANQVLGFSKNGGEFVNYTGMTNLPAVVNGSDWVINVGAQYENARYDGDIYDAMFLPGVDIRDHPAFISDYMDYRSSVWGDPV